MLFACKSGGDVAPDSLISQNAWEIVQFSDTDGKAIPQSALNSSAKLIFGMQFEFKSNGEVRGIDAQNKTIIQRGTWKFIDDESVVNVDLPGLNYDFKIVTLKTGMLTLQAPTGNFLSNVGDVINLEFQSVEQ
ncbi:hypothetical protein LAG90_16870 [Marinilongibacter aquaticus]|uniref:hypothetical protein n=1 Tax=Marinilongibacter aquaticus TaxID=2975157 RepID=UPI0021BDC0DB|nr:hypothetical protein [Marinilongibacter aquaticus]UBM58478.1 hypothetical protein LAG90_16870 [Marinilongibacter aquaticus]